MCRLKVCVEKGAYDGLNGSKRQALEECDGAVDLCAVCARPLLTITFVWSMEIYLLFGSIKALIVL